MADQGKSSKSVHVICKSVLYSCATREAYIPTRKKKLHLGHIAKSFALSQAPSIIVNGVKKSVLTDKDNSATNASEMRKRAYKLSSSISEFADGSSCMIDYNKRRKR